MRSNLKSCVFLLTLSVALSAFSQTRAINRITQAIDDRDTISLRGNVHPMLQKATDQGRMDGSTKLEGVSLVFKRTAEQEKPFRMLGLLTAIPMLYVCNVDEASAATGNELSRLVEARAREESAACVVISAKIEAEIAVLPPAERAEYLAAIGLNGAERIVRRLRGRGRGQRVEDGRLADIRQAEKAALESHC